MIFPFRRRHGVAGSVFAAALFLCIFPVARAQENSIQRFPAGAVDIGPLPASQTISVTLHLSLTPEHDAALMQFLSDVQNSGSPRYHQWLTPAQFGAQFGATPEQLAAITAFAAANNLTVSNVSASGLRVTLTGAVGNLELAMSPALHQVQLGGNLYFLNTTAPSLPSALAEITAVDGLSTLPSAHPLTISGMLVSDPLAAISSIVDTNSVRLASISSDACIEDFSSETQSALQSEMRQASAQGITVLAASDCGTRGSTGFPSALSEVTAVAVAPGISTATSPMLTEPRPAWQVAAGLPADSFRHEVDFTVSSLDALTQKISSVIATQTENNAPLRLGNINSTIYQNGTTKGLFTQPDNAAPGTWEPATGLGLADLDILGNIIWQPHGSHNSQTTVYLSTSYAVHGSQVSVYGVVNDPSFTVGYPPTGNITFTTNPNSTFAGTEPTNNGTSQSYSSNTLNAGNYSVVGTYYGDGTYAGSSGTAGLTIAPEASVLSASQPASVSLGQTINITVTDRSGSGVDTPYGTITLTEYGSTTLTYTQPLTAQGTGVATATFSIPAAQGGTLNLSINCNTAGGNPNFTCYTPISVPLTVTQAATKTALVSDPVTFTAGQQVALHATVTMTTPVSGFTPTYTGNVTFYDNGNNIGTATISGSGLATVVATITGANDTITAVYSGDGNFLSSTGSLNGTGGSGTSKTTVALTINPSSGLAASNYTLTATITSSSSSAATGTVTFTDTFNGQQSILGSATLVATGTSVSIAQLSTTGLLAGTHNIVATYSGSTSFTGATSNSVVLNLTDYSVTFSPTSLTLSAGTSGIDLVTINSLNGFKGTVTLACSAPSGTQTTCVFNPATITTSGNSQLLITTTKPMAIKSISHAGFSGNLLGTILVSLLLWMLLPSVRRRRPALFVLLVSCVLITSSGCTELDNVAPIVPISGTPLGTQLFTISTSGTDGVTTTYHNSKFQVTVQ